MAETPVGYFPDFPVSDPPQYTDTYETEIEEAEGGEEQRMSLRDNRRLWGVRTKDLDLTNQKTINDFLNAKRGEYAAFYFWNPVPETLSAYSVGTVSSQSSIVIPVKGNWRSGDAPITAVYSQVTVDDVVKNFTATANIGSGGEDRINFTDGNQTGTVKVTATYARLRYTVRNSSGRIGREFDPRVAAILARYPVTLIQLL